MINYANLHPKLAYALATNDIDRTVDLQRPYLSPNRFFGGAIMAGYMLRRPHCEDVTRKPHRALARRPMAGSPDERPELTFLRTIVNTSIQPEKTVLNLRQQPHRLGAGACSYADVSMASSLNSLQKENHIFRGGRIVTDEHAGPVFWQKAVGSLTALALQPVAIESVTYPAGSIMDLSIHDDFEFRNYGFAAGDGDVEVVAVSKIEAASFIRPSAFVMPPEQRLKHFPDLIEPVGFMRVHSQASALLGSATLQDVLSIVQSKIA